MGNEELKILKKEVLNAFDEAIQKGDWQSSLFLQTQGKQLHEARQRVATEFVVEESETDKQEWLTPPTTLDQQIVYVSLYRAAGNDLAEWESLLVNLSEYSLNRPIYEEEVHVQEFIRSKEQAFYEAYVSVHIKQKDIIDAGISRVSVDRFGHPLLTLRPSAVQISNVIEFVHNSKRYVIKNKHLVLRHN